MKIVTSLPSVWCRGLRPTNPEAYIDVINQLTHDKNGLVRFSFACLPTGVATCWKDSNCAAARMLHHRARRPFVTLVSSSKKTPLNVEFNRRLTDKLLYSSVSSPSKRFTHYSLPNPFNRTSSLSTTTGSIQPRYAAINARKLFLHKYPPLSTTRYSFMQLIEPEQRRVNDLSKVLYSSTGFEPGTGFV